MNEAEYLMKNCGDQGEGVIRRGRRPRRITPSEISIILLWHFDFQQRSMICIGGHVGRHTLALQLGGQNYCLLVCC